MVIDRVPQRKVLLRVDARTRASTAVGRRRRGVTAGLFVGLALRYHDSWVLPAYLVLAAGLVALSVIDLEHFLLPNRIVYPLALAVAGAARARRASATATGLRFGRARARRRRRRCSTLGVLHLVSPRSMGFGDVKLAFVLGLALG